MEIEIERLYRKETYTVGKLYIDGIYFCDTLEDRVRELPGRGLRNIRLSMSGSPVRVYISGNFSCTASVRMIARFLPVFFSLATHSES